MLIVLGIGCAHVPVNIKCPAAPQMLPVNVISGTVSGQDLANAITNHMALWAYIHQLRVLGCVAK